MEWGEFTATAVEYRLELEDVELPVLVEEFDFGRFIKIEAPSPEILEKFIQEFDLDRDRVIEKNSAELLAEELDRI